MVGHFIKIWQQKSLIYIQYNLNWLDIQYKFKLEIDIQYKFKLERRALLADTYLDKLYIAIGRYVSDNKIFLVEI